MEEKKDTEKEVCRNDLFVQISSALFLIAFFVVDIFKISQFEYKEIYYGTLFVTFVSGRSGLHTMVLAVAPEWMKKGINK